MKIEDYRIEYEFGDIVYLITDPEQEPRMITGISIRPNGLICYAVAWERLETHHYGIEISREKDMSLI